MININQLMELLGSNNQQIPNYAMQLKGALSQSYPGMLSMGNIDLFNRPKVNNNGKISTVFSMGIGVDGKEYLIPRVSDEGKILSELEAKELFKKSGKHLGVFDTRENATNYAKILHEQQQRLYASQGQK